MADDVAGRIDPRYTQGDLVRVARAQHQAEAEFVQAPLIEEGIPSMVRRSAGFDVPDMLAAGPRDGGEPTVRSYRIDDGAIEEVEVQVDGR